MRRKLCFAPTAENSRRRQFQAPPAMKRQLEPPSVLPPEEPCKHVRTSYEPPPETVRNALDWILQYFWMDSITLADLITLRLVARRYRDWVACSSKTLACLFNEGYFQIKQPDAKAMGYRGYTPCDTPQMFHVDLLFRGQKPLPMTLRFYLSGKLDGEFYPICAGRSNLCSYNTGKGSPFRQRARYDWSHLAFPFGLRLHSLCYTKILPMGDAKHSYLIAELHLSVKRLDEE